MESTLVFLVLGAFAGFVAGLLGVGGGLVIVPALAGVFAHAGLPLHHQMHMAIGTSLATIVVTSLSSMYAHHRHGAILWRVWFDWLPGLGIGAVAGVMVAGALDTGVLRRLFGAFELLVALQMLGGGRPRAHRGLPGRVISTGLGVLVGGVSSLLGIGGGTLTVPILVWCSVSIRNAVATSAACGLPIALAGAVAFVLAGQGQADLPAGSRGYVVLDAFAGIAVASMFTAPLGARLAHRLPTVLLRRVFAVFLALVGMKMLLG